MDLIKKLSLFDRTLNEIASNPMDVHIQKVHSNDATEQIQNFFSSPCDKSSLTIMSTPIPAPPKKPKVKKAAKPKVKAAHKPKAHEKPKKAATPKKHKTPKKTAAQKATPNPALENCPTTTEMLMHRKLRLPYDIIRPTVTTKHMKNITLENKFNKQHGAKPRFFKPGDRVIVTMYNGKLTWKHGTIWKRRGKVLYEVLVDNHIIIRHANQIRKGVNSNTDEHKLEEELFDILLDTFSLPKPAVAVPNINPKHAVPRQSSRCSKPVKHLQLDPKSKHYSFI